ncbi:uroporphyrinogen-III C-methyltransferase, partial [Xanthomonadaceae bacterium JHOS43]|nr:uroporphyrinogen-III C-methyltransferase [Xanthomonadaceae bacterium JHOS43]
MTDIDPNDTPATDAPAVPRRWPWLVALVVLFAVATLSLLAIRTVRQAGDEQTDLRARAQALQERFETMERGVEQLREGQQRLIQRLDSSSATNQVLREELLGMGERAGLLEDAVARLAQSRMSGESVLRLSEAEFLLSMGTERLNLHGDVASAIQAFSLAEGTLAGLDDPALATLRQTLTQELIQLRELPPDARPRLRAELAALAGQLPALPSSREDTVALA